MHATEKLLEKSCRKIARWFRDKVVIEMLPTGFILKLVSESQMTPTIGIVNEQLIGAQDDFDFFIDLMGYEVQTERVLFDPTKARFILDAGWSGKYWRKPSPEDVAGKTDLLVDTLGSRLPTKTSAIAVLLMSVVEREKRRRTKQAILHPFQKKA